MLMNIFLFVCLYIYIIKVQASVQVELIPQPQSLPQEKEDISMMECNDSTPVLILYTANTALPSNHDRWKEKVRYDFPGYASHSLLQQAKEF